MIAHKKTMNFSIRLSWPLKQKLDDYAKKHDRSLNNTVNLAIKQMLKSEDVNNKNIEE